MRNHFTRFLVLWSLGWRQYSCPLNRATFSIVTLKKEGWNKSKQKGKSSHLTSFRAPEVTAAFWCFKISETVCKLNGKERFDLLLDQCRVATLHGPQFKAKISAHRAPRYLARSSLNQMARLPWAPNGGDILPASSIFRPKQEKSEEKTHPHAIRASSSGDTIKASVSHCCYRVGLQEKRFDSW